MEDSQVDLENRTLQLEYRPVPDSVSLRFPERESRVEEKSQLLQIDRKEGDEITFSIVPFAIHLSSDTLIDQLPSSFEEISVNFLIPSLPTLSISQLAAFSPFSPCWLGSTLRSDAPSEWTARNERRVEGESVESRE